MMGLDLGTVHATAIPFTIIKGYNATTLLGLLNFFNKTLVEYLASQTLDS